MIQGYDFHSVFEYNKGTLIWKNPPPNHAEKKGLNAGFINIGKGKNKTYWQVRCFGKTFKRSRVVFYMFHGRWPSPIVDHINGVSLDDRIENLRECNYSQNTANSKNKKRTNGLPRGVQVVPSGRYRAVITKNGHTRYIGTYDTKEEASMAYKNRKVGIYGQFA